ncbi:hypothetical protein GJAV_G00063390 [Gymnothorax javanicus]|nr:hypothetical protein GJAV_G00063390 [Gymnothorax javanicus]
MSAGTAVSTPGHRSTLESSHQLWPGMREGLSQHILHEAIHLILVCGKLRLNIKTARPQMGAVGSRIRITGEMSEDTYWESVMFQLHRDHQLLQARDAIMELMNGRRRPQYNSLDPFNSFFFGPIPDAELGTIFVDDDDYTDDDSDYEDRRDKKEFCGFPRNFLDHGPARSRSPHPPHAPYRPGLRQIMHEQAEKNAKELIQEEERIKVRAEKKRLKKLRRKERKRKEKEEEEGNAVKNKDEEDQDVDDTIVKSKSSNSESAKNKKSNKTTSEVASAGPAVPLKKTQGNSALARNRPNSSGPSEDEDDESDDEEEGEASDVDSIASELEMLDMNSCFVSKAATIAKRKLEVKAKAESGRSPRKQEAKQQKPTQPSVQRPAAEPLQNGVEQQQQQENTEVACAEDVVKKSMELAVIGNHMGNSGRFDMAVVYFTEAIMHNPKDFRLFGNRSFCYEKMLQYDKALKDADVSLAMSPGWIKGLYRKGRALAGLKRYSEAAAALKEVLQKDPSSSDAAQELMRVQIMQLMEMGFSREQSSNALIIHGTVEKALEAFSSIQDEKFGISKPPAANATQPVEEEWAVAGQKAQPSVNRGTVPQTQPMSNPRPPAMSNHAKSVATPELFPLWVGNLVPAVTEKTISNLFSNVGKIHSIRMLPDRRCAFVNYTRKEDCDVAVDKFNGIELEETVLSVRYPDRIHTHLGASKSAKQATDATPRVVPNIAPMKSQECVYWRNSGCIKKDRCAFLHIPGHRGIDRGKDKLAP